MNWFEKYIKYPVKGFFTGIKNIFAYMSVMYKDRGWDYCFMLEMERKKLKETMKWYEENEYGSSINGKKYYQTIKWAYDCLCILLDDDWWTIEYLEDENWLKIASEEWDKRYHIKPYINIKNYKRFMPWLTDKAIKKHPNLYKIDLREEKAWRLYHKIREQYMRNWWD